MSHRFHKEESSDSEIRLQCPACWRAAAAKCRAAYRNVPEAEYLELYFALGKTEKEKSLSVKFFQVAEITDGVLKFTVSVSAHCRICNYETYERQIITPQEGQEE